MSELTQAYLLSTFTYDPVTGVLAWRSHRCMKNAVAGYRHGSGYRYVHCAGKMRLEHRVIWVMQTGEQPNSIDHVNGRKDDNRWVNLRSVSRMENQQNQTRAHSRNPTGLLGVQRILSKTMGWRFRASLRLHGKRKVLGMFSTAQEAHLAYVEAKRRLHPGNLL